MKILFTGGGTGGHLVPLLAIISELKKLSAEKKIKLELMLIVPNGGLNTGALGKEIKIKTIKAGKLRRYFSLRNVVDVFKIPIGTVQSLYYIYRFKPDVVFSKGGFASVPPVIAAWIFKIPVLTHESDIVPGLANRIISFFSKIIFVSFPDTEKCFPNKKVVFTGSIVRSEIFNGDRYRAQEVFGLKENLPTVLIFGGSQGARRINDTVLRTLPAILEKCQVIHICGTNNYQKVVKSIEKLGLKNIGRYKVYPYLESEMKEAYALADIVVSRAGANSLSEIIALEKPSIVIPLPTSANDHQMNNAVYFSRKGMLILLREEELSAGKLSEKIFELLPEEGIEKNIKHNIRQYNNSTKKNSTKLIAEEILNFV
jgi:UDP-N-acetylglucosamine--N-acetylmuramyl-(pentapeptide) pyrophosphoryl-undecaprenol N-acetylglucosamine transferase